MVLWYDEHGCRRGDLTPEGYEQAIKDAVAVLLFLAAEGGSTVSEVAAGVTGLDQRRAGILLDLLVDAGGATENEGTYTGVLVEDT